MKKYIFLSIITFTIIISTGHNSFAQTVDVRLEVPTLRRVTTDWRSSLRELKESVDMLLEKSQQLSSEKKLLGSELLRLQESIEAIQEENRMLLDEPSRINELIMERDKQEKSFTKEIKRLESEIITIKKQSKPHQKRLEEVEKKKVPWEAKFKELKAREDELRAELEKVRSFGEDEAKQAMQDLRKQIALNKSKEQEIRDMIDKTLEEYTSILDDIKRTKNENDKLSQELAQVQKEQRIYSTKLETLQRQLPDSDTAYQNRLAVKEGLQRRGNDLGDQIEKVRVSIDDIKESLAAKGLDSALLDEMTAVRDENQSLVNKIDDLNEVAALVKRENAMIAALLDVQKEKRTDTLKGAALLPQEALSQSIETLEAMGYAYAEQGMYAESIAYYQEALRQGGNKKDIYFNLGYIYYQLGDLQEAIKCYKLVLRTDPRDTEAKRNIARLKKELARSKRK